MNRIISFTSSSLPHHIGLNKMDKITQLFHQLHPDESFNFYKLCGFRAGYLGKKSEFNNFERLPDSLVNDWHSGYAEGKEARKGNIGVR